MRLFLLSLPAVVIAMLLGRMIDRRMTGHGLVRVVYAGLTLVGLVLILQATRR